MAPEIVAKREYYGRGVDIWAAGVLLFVMICGRFPFKGSDDRQLFKEISTGDIDFPVNTASVSPGA